MNPSDGIPGESRLPVVSIPLYSGATAADSHRLPHLSRFGASGGQSFVKVANCGTHTKTHSIIGRDHSNPTRVVCQDEWRTESDSQCKAGHDNRSELLLPHPFQQTT